jgi:gamma-glutamylcyclotransferase (GGCT)/AIG2-like uncharacterized protein YtfP
MNYFAYGSNMNLHHMRRICGWHFNVLGVAVLQNHEFGPDTRGYANIRPQAGKKVFGVLYDVDQHCIDELDEFEGYPKIFGRQEITVIDEDGQDQKAWAYIEPADRFGNTPVREDYMRRVVGGARQNNLPVEWIEFLNTFLA